MKKMCLRWCNLEATILEIHIDSLQNGIELNCPFDEVCAAQAELSSLLLKSYEGGLLLNMFWNASHMRSALEYVLEWCKKVCSGVVPIPLFLLFCYSWAIRLYLWPVHHFSFCTCSSSTIGSFKRGKSQTIYNTPVDMSLALAD